MAEREEDDRDGREKDGKRDRSGRESDDTGIGKRVRI